ncbi:MAG: undecaprenyl-diphosphate phosphatase [Candidatus Bathyarchaeia archaeon]
MELSFEIILLGIIQGLTEWLPISSTGHIRLAESLLGFSLPLIFDVIMHVATLSVTLVFFRSEIGEIIKALSSLNFKSREGRMALQILAGSLPTAIIGLLIITILEELPHDLSSLSITFLVSGLLIGMSRMGRQSGRHMNYQSALIIGVAQGFSVIPGLSRSGLTIATALILGIDREEAFKFSFLLSIPSILGALILTLYMQYSALLATEVGWLDLLSAFLAAVVIGYASLKVLYRLLHKFHLFALYSLILGSILATINIFQYDHF